MKNLMIVLGTLIVLVSSSIVGCRKMKEAKGKAEQNPRETRTTAREETAQNSKERSNSNSTAKKEAINFFAEKEVSKPEKVPSKLSAGEVVKRFYAAVNEKDYTKAQNCVSSRFLNSLKSHPVSKSQGIEKALAAIAARDILKEITIIHEHKSSISASRAKQLGLRELQEKGGEIYNVRYELTFKSPFDKLIRKQTRTESLILEGDTYKIMRVPDEVVERSNVKGIQTFIVDNLIGRFLEYRVVDVSKSPAHREGWTTYTFTIGIRNDSSELIPIKLANIYAVADGHKFEGRSFVSEKLKEPTFGYDRKSGERVKVFTRISSTSMLENSILMPGYSVIYENSIEVPTLAPQIDFYLVTPDLRCSSISTQGTFSPLAIFPSQTTDELVLGDTFVVKDYLEITLIGLDLTKRYSTSKKADKLRFWIRMKNLALGDIPISNEVLNFQLYSEDGYTGSARIKSVTIPPLFEKIRPLDPYLEIEHGRNYALLIGVVSPKRILSGTGISAPIVGREESKKFLAHKIYRFVGQATPALVSRNVTIEEVKGNWYTIGGTYFLKGITLRVKNNGDWPVYVEKVRARSTVKRDVRVEKWLESHEEITVTVMPPQSGAGGNIEIKVLNGVDEVLASCSWEANPSAVPATSQRTSQDKEKLPRPTLEPSDKQELVTTLEDLQSAMIKKINFEVDVTSQCFTSVKEYRRAKLLADVLRPVLKVLQGTLSLLSKISDTTTLSGQVKTSLGNAQYVSEAASLFFMVNGLRESGEKLYYAIDDTAGYVRTVKDMLQAADQTTVIRMDPRAYKQVIKQYLDSEQGTPLIVARTSELAPDKKPAKGALVLYKTIREEFRRLIDQIQRSELPQDFPLQDAVAEIERLKHQIVEAGVHNIDVHYSIYHQGRKVHQSRKLGAVAEHNKAFAQVAGALAKRLDIEIHAECAQLAATGADAAYIVTYKVPGAGEAVKVTHQVSLLPQIVIEGKKMFTVDPEEQFYQMPQEMLFSLAIEFSNLWRIADDTVLSLTELLK